MSTMMDSIGERMAGRLRERRETLGLSLAELAERSGVSKGMIGKVETAAASPTAGVLGRLCAGLEITMSGLMASVESEDAVLLPAVEQPVWTDPETGLKRVAVSPATGFGAVEVARVTLPAGAAVDYPTPPHAAFTQQLVGVSGVLRFTVGERSFDVGAGDCAAARIDRPTRLEALGAAAAEYLVIVQRG